MFTRMFRHFGAIITATATATLLLGGCPAASESPSPAEEPELESLISQIVDEELNARPVPEAEPGPPGAAGPAGPGGPEGPPGASPFQLVGDDAVYTAGNVGIGTDSPQATLDVNGMLRVSDLGTTTDLPLTLFVNNTPGLQIEDIRVDLAGVPHFSRNVIAGYGGHDSQSGNRVTPGAYGATISGGGFYWEGEAAQINRVTDHLGTVGGGASNYAGNNDDDVSNSTCATVGGGYQNRARGYAATVAGGGWNDSDGDQATVGGGWGNLAGGLGSMVAGGRDNEAIGDHATVGGGYNNQVTGVQAAICGGVQNRAGGGEYAFVGGGYHNDAVASASTVAGGYQNCASGARATVPGGAFNDAAANYSFAAGYHAKANHEGTFVWADSQDADFTSAGENQFLIRAAGGVSINTNVTAFALSVNGEAGKPGGGMWANLSDARLKQNIEPLTGALERLLRLRGVTFEFKEPARHLALAGRQIGLIAQEVEPVFPDWVDEDARGYKYVTVRGLEALVVEALRELRSEKDAEITELRTRIAELETLVAKLDGE